MNESRKTVLACIDGSALSEAVVDYGAWISRTVANPLKLLHNIDQRYTPEPDLSGNLGLGAREDLMEALTELEAKFSRMQAEQGKLLLANAHARAVAQAACEPSKLQMHGSLGETLAEMEEEIRVLVIGIRGEDNAHRENRIGAQLETVIRAMHRPVLVVNRHYARAPRRILLAYDDSRQARKALEMVALSPLYQGMHCHIVHVARDARAEALPLDEAARHLQAAGLSVTTDNLQGEVGPVLQDYQRQHELDLTVMGAFGQSRLRELLFGSVTVKMLCNSRVPLLLLR